MQWPPPVVALPETQAYPQEPECDFARVCVKAKEKFPSFSFAEAVAQWNTLRTPPEVLERFQQRVSESRKALATEFHLKARSQNPDSCFENPNWPGPAPEKRAEGERKQEFESEASKRSRAAGDLAEHLRRNKKERLEKELDGYIKRGELVIGTFKFKDENDDVDDGDSKGRDLGEVHPSGRGDRGNGQAQGGCGETGQGILQGLFPGETLASVRAQLIPANGRTTDRGVGPWTAAQGVRGIGHQECSAQTVKAELGVAGLGIHWIAGEPSL